MAQYVSIYIPEEFQEEFHKFNQYIQLDKRIYKHPGARKEKLFSLAFRLLIRRYNKKFAEILHLELEERDRLEKEKKEKESQLNRGTPSNAQTNSAINS
jgi:hypothetical protein